MPPVSPRMSWNLAMPLAATNSRIFFWFVAVLGLSAGTRWSKMMAIRDGSQIVGARPVPANTSRNWLITSAAFSCDIARSTLGSTTSPAATAGSPAARARIFSATVMPMTDSGSDDALRLQFGLLRRRNAQRRVDRGIVLAEFGRRRLHRARGLLEQRCEAE